MFSLYISFILRLKWTEKSAKQEMNKTDYVLPLDAPFLGSKVSIKLSGELLSERYQVNHYNFLIVLSLIFVISIFLICQISAW